MTPRRASCLLPAVKPREILVRTTEYELLTIRDGMIVRIREFYDKSAALEAAGLRE